MGYKQRAPYLKQIFYILRYQLRVKVNAIIDKWRTYGS